MYTLLLNTACNIYFSCVAYLTEGLVRVQKRFDFPLLVLQLAVLDSVLPVARLFLYVKVQTGRTSDGLQALHSNRVWLVDKVHREPCSTVLVSSATEISSTQIVKHEML